MAGTWLTGIVSSKQRPGQCVSANLLANANSSNRFVVSIDFLNSLTLQADQREYRYIWQCRDFLTQLCCNTPSFIYLVSLLFIL